MMADTISFLLCGSHTVLLCSVVYSVASFPKRVVLTCHAVTAVDHNIDQYLVSCGYRASQVAYKVSFVFTHKWEDKFCCCFLFSLLSLI